MSLIIVSPFSSGGGSVSGIEDVPGLPEALEALADDIAAIEPADIYEAIAHSTGNLDLNFANGDHKVVTLTTNMTFGTLSNMVTNKIYHITFIASGADRTINFPSTHKMPLQIAGSSAVLKNGDFMPCAIVYNGASYIFSVSQFHRSA